MPTDETRAPDTDVVILRIVSPSVAINTWKAYRFNSHFLTPADSFSFTVAAHELNDAQKAAIVPGAEVELTVNGHRQGSGYIDQLEYRVTRSGGTEIDITGRDKLAPVVDSGANPDGQFKASMNLLDVLKYVFGPYGWANDSDFEIDNTANRNIITGSTRGTPTSKKGKPLKSFVLHQLRPYANEGAFAFAARLAQREGLWIWLSADGQKVVVGKPNFDQGAKFKLQRLRDGKTNNILDGVVIKNLGDQPSIVIADGFAGGGEFGRSSIRAYAVNPAISAPNDSIVSAWKAKGAAAIELSYKGEKTSFKTARPLYLHDDESKTQEQLENYVRRELALRLRRSLTCSVTVAGHTQGESVWAVDSVVSVKDEVSGLDEPLWCLQRTFQKSRWAGTTTELELIRPHTLSF